MKYITVNDTKYECKEIIASGGLFSFILEGWDPGTIVKTFKDVTKLSVCDDNDNTSVYGTYSNLVFRSVTVHDDNTITVVMYIPSDSELRLSALEASQAEQDEILAEILYGGM